MTVEERSLGEDVDVQKVGNNLGVPVLVIGQVAGHRRVGQGLSFFNDLRIHAFAPIPID
jgi:hypothetical protein